MNGGGMDILLIVAMIAIFYFLLIRPQQKRQKEITKFRSALEKGSKVTTAGGLLAVIREVKETTFMVEIAPGVKVEIDKNSVFPSAAEAAQANQEKDNGSK